MNKKAEKEELLKKIFLSLFDENINGWEMGFLDDVREKLEFSERDKVFLSEKQLNRLENIFYKKNIYREDLINLPYGDIKKTSIDLSYDDIRSKYCGLW